MYLSRLYIRNFRSIKTLDITFSEGKNVIVGKNNVGKSNIIRALDIILGESSPTYAKSENVTEKDFLTWKEAYEGEVEICSENELFIWCELTRDKSEALNYEELYKGPGFWILVESNGPRNHRRVPAHLLPAEFGHIFKPNREDRAKYSWQYINTKLVEQSPLNQQFDDKYCFAFAFRACQDIDGGIMKEIRFLYRENDESDWVLSLSAPFRNEFLQSAIIPAFRDPGFQLRPTKWSWYGKLLRYLTTNHSKSAELESAFESVREVSDQIFAEVKETVVSSSLQVAFPGTELHFQFNADARTDLYQTCVIYVDDGFKSQLTEKGSGIQSATTIGLFNYYTRHVNTKTSALLCIEEPEIYLHPHARRVISDRLDGFLEKDQNQVILTTHSTEFIRTPSDNLTVILVQKGEEGTTGRAVDLRKFKHLLVENNYNELFFADKVVVCEGYDSYILRAVAGEYFPGILNEQNVSIVSVGGKDRISELVRLVLELGIKCFIFADFDYLLRDASAERKKYGAKNHQTILNLGLPFFMQECIRGSSGNKLLGQIEKLRNQLKAENVEAFYTAKTADAFAHERLPEALKTLRQVGIGLMSGEIENCSKDDAFMSPSNKLNLETVFDLNARLSSGERVSDILDVGEIVEFCEAVFSDR